MFVVYISLVVLMGSHMETSFAHSGSSVSKDSGDSKHSNDNDKYCRNVVPSIQTIVDKITSLSPKNKPFPACTCGPSGTISKFDIYDCNSKKTTTVLSCSGCAGPHVPITSLAMCANVAGVYRLFLDQFCLSVYSRCNVTVSRCDCPIVTTKAALTSLVVTTKITSSTKGPPQTTTQIPQTTTNTPQTEAPPQITTQTPQSTTNTPQTEAPPMTSTNAPQTEAPPMTSTNTPQTEAPPQTISSTTHAVPAPPVRYTTLFDELPDPDY